MSEMVERVARAMCMADGEIPDFPSHTTNEPFWTYYCDMARVAIEAMREPTEAMRAAGYIVTVDDETDVWQTMIDASLK